MRTDVYVWSLRVLLAWIAAQVGTAAIGVLLYVVLVLRAGA